MAFLDIVSIEEYKHYIDVAFRRANKQAARLNVLNSPSVAMISEIIELQLKRGYDIMRLESIRGTA